MVWRAPLLLGPRCLCEDHHDGAQFCFGGLLYRQDRECAKVKSAVIEATVYMRKLLSTTEP